jgi:PAS domain S-box-containing protein
MMAAAQSLPWSQVWTSDVVLEALPIPVYITDREGRILAFNPAARELWGATPERGAVRWSGFRRLCHPNGHTIPPKSSPMALAVREGRAVHGAEAVAERPDGQQVPLLAYVTPLHDDRGVVAGAVNVLIEAGSTRTAEQAQHHLAAIIASSHDAIISKDLGGIVQTWNESARRVFGYAPEEIVGQAITVIIPPERQHEEVEILRRIRAGEVVDHFETVRIHRNGSRIPLSLTLSPIRSDDGKIIGVSSIARDITQQKESEQRIRTLMREVNHRVKNQFAVILSMVRETRSRASNPVEFEAQVRERIMALARSHDLLVKGEWRGATLFELLLAHLEIFASQERVRLSGPTIVLQPMALQYIGMAFHELATNAAKYGALAQAGGTIEVSWSIGPARHFVLTWIETVAGSMPGRSKSNGFGTVVLEKVTPSAVAGTGRIDHRPDGISWTLSAPLDSIEAQQDPDFGLKRAEPE